LVGRVRPDKIVHLAALAGVRASISEPGAFADTNVGGTLNVLESARHHDVSQVVLASTSSVYGRAAAIPFVEDDPAICPAQPYAVTKRSAEMMACAYHDLHGLECTVLRLFTVYGPRGRPDMMPYKLVQSVATGSDVSFFGAELRRDWTYVGDIVDGIVGSLARPLGFQILNLGRGRPVSLGDFVDAVEAVSGRQARLRHEPPPSSEMPVTHADISRARRLIGYEPTVDVAAGVEALWAWYVADRCTTH
ncbi:MAG: NAD-dependent epimerase/dehydratase family protein, partial [Ilumatobacteraceae bacterium]